MNTARKPEIAVLTTEQQNTGKNLEQTTLVHLGKTASLRRNDPDMLTELYILMSRPAIRTSLLYLLIVIRDQAISLGRHLDLAEILTRCQAGHTPQVRRWVKHLLKEASETGLIHREGTTGEHRIQNAGTNFIQQAAATRMALWRLNPRMSAAQIHAIVVEEEYDHPLHYNTNMQKHVIQPMDGVPSPRKTGKQGVRRDKTAGTTASNASSFGDPFHSLAAATGAWGRA